MLAPAHLGSSRSAREREREREREKDSKRGPRGVKQLTAIKLEYPLVIARITGKREETVIIQPGSTVEELFGILAGRNGDEFRDMLFGKDGQLKEIFGIRINGKTFHDHKKVCGHYLNESDVVSVTKTCC
jgi:hypothetical protein